MMAPFVMTFLVLTVFQQAKVAGSVLSEDVVPYDQGNCDILEVILYNICLCLIK